MDFPIERQLQRYWCWAAVPVSVDRYMAAASTLRQCEVANGVLPSSVCCAVPVPAACDQAESLGKALRWSGWLAWIRNRPLSFAEITQQLDVFLPVCCQIQWLGGGGHAVIITGYREMPSGSQWLEICDPYFSGGIILYDEFKDNYRGRGTWRASYGVQRGSTS